MASLKQQQAVAHIQTILWVIKKKIPTFDIVVNKGDYMDDLVYIFCSSTVVTEGLKEIASMQSKTPGLKGGICDHSQC